MTRTSAETRWSAVLGSAPTLPEATCAFWAVIALLTSSRSPAIDDVGTGPVTTSPIVAAGDSGPDDLAVAPFPKGDLVLLVGRDGHPFRRRERRQLLALARIAERVGTILPD